MDDPKYLLMIKVYYNNIHHFLPLIMSEHCLSIPVRWGTYCHGSCIGYIRVMAISLCQNKLHEKPGIDIFYLVSKVKGLVLILSKNFTSCYVIKSSCIHDNNIDLSVR